MSIKTKESWRIGRTRLRRASYVIGMLLGLIQLTRVGELRGEEQSFRSSVSHLCLIEVPNLQGGSLQGQLSIPVQEDGEIASTVSARLTLEQVHQGERKIWLKDEDLDYLFSINDYHAFRRNQVASPLGLVNIYVNVKTIERYWLFIEKGERLLMVLENRPCL